MLRARCVSLGCMVALCFGCASVELRPAANGCGICDQFSDFSASCRLVTAPCLRSSVSVLRERLDEAFQGGKPIVLYVHGRGGEPAKSAKQRILEALEAEYGVKVLMFNWDSKGLLLHRPVDKAVEASEHLRAVIADVARYRREVAPKSGLPISLLAHSMGNIVLRNALTDSGKGAADLTIFANVLLTGSDEDAEGHADWINGLTPQGTTLIVINGGDGTLAHSHHPDGKTPLGLGPKAPFVSSAYYLDLTGQVGKAHRVFAKGRLHNRVEACKIVSAMLRGEKLPTSSRSPQDGQWNTRRIVPNSKQDAEDDCFRGVLSANEGEDSD